MQAWWTGCRKCRKAVLHARHCATRPGKAAAQQEAPASPAADAPAAGPGASSHGAGGAMVEQPVADVRPDCQPRATAQRQEAFAQSQGICRLGFEKNRCSTGCGGTRPPGAQAVSTSGRIRAGNNRRARIFCSQGRLTPAILAPPRPGSRYFCPRHRWRVERQRASVSCRVPQANILASRKPRLLPQSKRLPCSGMPTKRSVCRQAAMASVSWISPPAPGCLRFEGFHHIGRENVASTTLQFEGAFSGRVFSSWICKGHSWACAGRMTPYWCTCDRALPPAPACRLRRCSSAIWASVPVGGIDQVVRQEHREGLVLLQHPAAHSTAWPRPAVAADAHKST